LTLPWQRAAPPQGGPKVVGGGDAWWLAGALPSNKRATLSKSCSYGHHRAAAQPAFRLSHLDLINPHPPPTTVTAAQLLMTHDVSLRWSQLKLDILLKKLCAV
jgi:hypothetical protein